MSMDKLAATGAIFFFIVVAAYLIVFAFQYKNMTSESERISVLLARVALFLPLYALFMLISLGAPKAYAAMTIPTAYVEGYSFYCFLSILVVNLGGPAKVVEAIQGRPLICCTSSCPTEPDKFYNKVVWVVYQLILVRPIVVILAAICSYSNSKAGRALNVVLSLVAFVLLARSLIHFVLFYESVLEKSKNLNGVLKVMLLKFSVGLIVLQGLVAQFIIAANAEPYNDDSNWDKEDKTQRGYCILVLLEFVILTLPYLLAYAPKVNPSILNDPAVAAAPSSPTFFHFLCNVLSVHDIFGILAFKDTMTQNLTENQK